MENNLLDQTAPAPAAPLTSVFVYGTLKKGYGNHRHATAVAKPEIEEGVLTNYQMIHLGGFPGILPDEYEVAMVHGEVFTYSADQIAEALRHMDRLEGYREDGPEARNMYLRRRVTVRTALGEQECWTYVWNRPLDEEDVLIPDGIW